jgi:hypothetical protein|tara:strand:+ start:1355 stop:1849 length:495 start_codon:yes stop_codon:yes gene_type:complete
MDKVDTLIAKIRQLREAAPTNSTGAGIAGFDKYLFPMDDDTLTQDYQTPAEVGLAKDEFMGVYPVMKLQLNKSSDGPSIDSMVDASKEYMNVIDDRRLSNIMNMARSIKEEVAAAPTNNVGGGAIAGTAPAGDDPPVRLKKKRKPTPVGRYGTRRTWMQNLKNG